MPAESTLHGMLERWGLEVKKRVDSLSDRSAGISYGYAACRENLGPLADQLQAVVERMPCLCDHDDKWKLPNECDKHQLQRILGTPGGTK